MGVLHREGCVCKHFCLILFVMRVIGTLHAFGRVGELSEIKGQWHVADNGAITQKHRDKILSFELLLYSSISLW